MRAFTRNASSRDELKDEEDPASPTTPLDYSGTTTGLKGRPTARFSSIDDSLSTPSPRHSTHVQVPRDKG